MSDRIISAAKALFLHNGETYADRDMAEVAWMLDEELQQFWIAQVEVVVGALA